MSFAPIQLDFSGFVEKSSVDYSFLFASKCPSLVGKDLCEYLVKMDEEEYNLVVAENKEFQNIDHSYRYFERAKITSIALGILCGIAILYFSFRRTIAALTEQQIEFAAIGEVGATIIGFILLLISGGITISKRKAIENKDSIITQNRYLRLQAKVGNLGDQIFLLAREEVLVREQLCLSRDYFCEKMRVAFLSMICIAPSSAPQMATLAARRFSV